jgi:plasmid replication initiation protein
LTVVIKSEKFRIKGVTKKIILSPLKAANPAIRNEHMPKTPKTALKQPALPVEIHASGNPWEPSGATTATVPLPNDIIITKVHGSYTERDRKLWAFLVAAVWDDLLTVRVHELSVSKINAIFHELGGEKNVAWLWESVIRLLQTVVEWEHGPDGDRITEATQLLGWADIKKEIRLRGYLRFSIHPSLCAVIRTPCRFSRLRIHFMIGLSGKYAVTLYMLLESVANMKTPVLDVELAQLRQWLKVPEEKLEKWFDLKRRAIEPALKQINGNPEAAGFTVAMEEIKEGRAVDRVRFIVAKTEARLTEEKSYRPAPEKPGITAAPSSSSAAYNLPTSAYEQAKKAAPNWDIYELERQWREWMKDKPVPDNLSGAFVNFCKTKAKKSIAPTIDAAKRAENEKRERAKKRAEEEKHERDRAELDLSTKWFEALPDTVKKSIESEYIAASNSIDAGFLKKKGYTYTPFLVFVKLNKWRSQSGT